jgi:hypothetical protein
MCIPGLCSCACGGRINCHAFRTHAEAAYLVLCLYISQQCGLQLQAPAKSITCGCKITEARTQLCQIWENVYTGWLRICTCWQNAFQPSFLRLLTFFLVSRKGAFIVIILSSHDSLAYSTLNISLYINLQICSTPVSYRSVQQIYIHIYTHTHTHTHIYIYMYIYMCVYLFS